MLSRLPKLTQLIDGTANLRGAFLTLSFLICKCRVGILPSLQLRDQEFSCRCRKRPGQSSVPQAAGNLGGVDRCPFYWSLPSACSSPVWQGV